MRTGVTLRRAACKASADGKQHGRFTRPAPPTCPLRNRQAAVLRLRHAKTSRATTPAQGGKRQHACKSAQCPCAARGGAAKSPVRRCLAAVWRRSCLTADWSAFSADAGGVRSGVRMTARRFSRQSGVHRAACGVAGTGRKGRLRSALVNVAGGRVCGRRMAGPGVRMSGSRRRERRPQPGVVNAFQRVWSHQSGSWPSTALCG